ncbi:hypothetical protein LTR67_000874 [Exophiala xenobiotica]
MPFGQLVIGPPGAGKSTYCNGMQQFMGAIGRKCSVVNLDPANDLTGYEAAVDVRELVTLESIMGGAGAGDEGGGVGGDEGDGVGVGLGPNGGVLYALEELEENFEWLEERLKNSVPDWEAEYVLFDCPGQVELFTHHASLRRIFARLEKRMGYRLVVVNLIDSYALTLPSLYISTLLLSLRSMLQLDMTHINVLTKIDNLSKYPPLPFNLDFYTEVQDLSYLLPSLEEESPMFGQEKYAALNEAIVNLVEEFGLVGYETLAVEDKKSMMSLLRTIDRAGGYAFGGAEGANDTVWQVAVREGMGGMDVRDVQERWIDQKDEWDERERMEWEEEQKRREEEWERGVEDGGIGNDVDGHDLPSMTGDSGVKVKRRAKAEPKPGDGGDIFHVLLIVEVYDAILFIPDAQRGGIARPLGFGFVQQALEHVFVFLFIFSALPLCADNVPARLAEDFLLALSDRATHPGYSDYTLYRRGFPLRPGDGVHECEASPDEAKVRSGDTQDYCTRAGAEVHDSQGGLDDGHAMVAEEGLDGGANCGQ